MNSVYLIEGARTPNGSFGGSLKNLTDIELGVVASKEALKRSNIPSEQIDQVFFGNVIHTSKAASFLARHIALYAGVPVEAPALTVNRLCGSGLQSVVSAAQAIMLGEAQTALCGGAENMSQAPHVIRNSRFGTGLNNLDMDDMLAHSLADQYIGYGMGITAEDLAAKYEISREEQDEFAVSSQRKAAAARESGRFAREIVAVEVKDKKGSILVSEDEHIRQGTTLEKLSKLRPAFKKDGTVTAGNSSGINDGAAAVVLASGQYLEDNPEVKPLARIISWGLAGVEPALMGIGPAPSSRKALSAAGLSWNDIDLIEINEAFAAQTLACIKELDLDMDKVNVNGGAVALGHPVGASGARILYSLALELQDRQGKYGLASLCIGGGQGISVIIERV
ncbi:acetyl-CoA C-acetyltransferase [Psychrobacillus sp. OK032]|uniref:thiolase family protein n=1 Tax=Psychrobacillus sp. OK032 TaxID=1884358 RepID=UPI0008AFE3F1|nr:acetyl-CoA C-acetyltransferase [Psychrobacillus sp. OK032]SER82103.1 acetyl-CoA C-acetyltransferase [Psychrobacillus sp. OK032]